MFSRIKKWLLGEPRSQVIKPKKLSQYVPAKPASYVRDAQKIVKQPVAKSAPARKAVSKPQPDGTVNSVSYDFRDFCAEDIAPIAAAPAPDAPSGGHSSHSLGGGGNFGGSGATGSWGGDSAPASDSSGGLSDMTCDPRRDVFRPSRLRHHTI